MALLAYWVGLCHASAFYDPGAQRWLNRDPLGDESTVRQVVKNPNSPHAYYLRYEGSGNIYEFNHENPEGFVDKNGRQIAIVIPVFGGTALAALWLAACEASPACKAALNNAIKSIGRSIPCPANPPEQEKNKKCTYECPFSGTITWEGPDDGLPCPSTIDQEGEVCRLVPETGPGPTPGPPPRR